MKYLIQINDDKEIIQDFAYTTMDAIKFNNWFYGNNDFKYNFIKYKDLDAKTVSKDIVPVGSVEFVLKYYELLGINNIKPINIIENFDKDFIGRKMSYNVEDFYDDELIFVKSLDNLKDDINAWYHPEDDTIKNKNIICSEYIDIKSEYRCFIYNGKLLDARCYLGDFKLAPNYNRIEDMIKNFKNPPQAYTLDVGINDTDTFLIEVHHFFSCGLYGFNDNSKYLKMLKATHKEIINGFYK